MEHPLGWLEIVILIGASVLAGAVNAVAGGGTLISFPALIFAHRTAQISNATNTVALWPGALSSFWAYRSELGRHRREIIWLSIPSILGGLVGAVLMVTTSEKTFARLVPYLILLATGVFIVQEPLARLQRRLSGAGKDSTPTADGPSFARNATPLRWVVVLVSQFLVGVYGGYFGAGIGILMLAVYGILGFSNIHEANAVKNLNAMFINGIAAVLFIFSGLIDWPSALVMSVGSIVGGYAGAGAARRLGQKNVRRIVIAIGLAMTATMFFKGTSTDSDRPVHRHDVDSHAHPVTSAAEKDAFDRTDVAVITAPGHGHVPHLGDYVVRRIEVNPAVSGTKDAQPSVCSVRADKLWLARSRIGQEIAADIPRCQAERSYASDFQMREVLAYAAPLLEDLHRRRAHARSGWVVAELAEDAAGKIKCRFQ
jgi:uncharacterized membrane protein YfcA